MLTKLKMSKEQSETCTYTSHLYQVCGDPASQIKQKVLGDVRTLWDQATGAIGRQLFDQIENSLWEIYDAD